MVLGGDQRVARGLMKRQPRNAKIGLARFFRNCSLLSPGFSPWVEGVIEGGVLWGLMLHVTARLVTRPSELRSGIYILMSPRLGAIS